MADPLNIVTPSDQATESVASLAARVAEFAEASGAVSAETTAHAATLVLHWIRHFEVLGAQSAAPELLTGARAAIIETAAYQSLGLARAAISSIRQQIDLLLGYTFFCDHPREWEGVTATGNGFMLKGDVMKYHVEQHPKLQARLGYLRGSRKLELDEIYRVMSAHVHAQSTLTVPRGPSLDSLCSDKNTAAEVAVLQRKAAEALSDYLVALYADSWADLPDPAVQRVRQSLTATQRPLFFR